MGQSQTRDSTPKSVSNKEETDHNGYQDTRTKKLVTAYMKQQFYPHCRARANRRTASNIFIGFIAIRHYETLSALPDDAQSYRTFNKICKMVLQYATVTDTEYNAAPPIIPRDKKLEMRSKQNSRDSEETSIENLCDEVESDLDSVISAARNPSAWTSKAKTPSVSPVADCVSQTDGQMHENGEQPVKRLKSMHRAFHDDSSWWVSTEYSPQFVAQIQTPDSGHSPGMSTMKQLSRFRLDF